MRRARPRGQDKQPPERHTFWFFLEDTASVVIVYRTTSQTQAENVILPAPGLGRTGAYQSHARRGASHDGRAGEHSCGGTEHCARN